MKVFLSWSGEKSHKVALVFRDWFPSVIQSLEPYVSSEDIDKGTRWSTDIAKELEDSTFGILCVTKENLTAPWLTFEAGALSKTMDKSFVSPFLFDIKRSEVDGPILQFQSTIFNKDDVHKLLKTLNKACGEEQLTDERLEKAFNVWWPTLENELQALKEVEENEGSEGSSVNSPESSEILEEILDLSRTNQKLLRNPDSNVLESLSEMSDNLMKVLSRLEKERRAVSPRRRGRFHAGFIDELVRASMESSGRIEVPAQIILSVLRYDYPWLYDVGMDAVAEIRVDGSSEQATRAVADFGNLMEYTFEHPTMRRATGAIQEHYVMAREVAMLLASALHD